MTLIMDHLRCVECAKKATIDLNGRPYCSEHALEKVRKVEHIPPMKTI